MDNQNFAIIAFGLVIGLIANINPILAQSETDKLDDSQLVVESQIKAFHQGAHKKAFSYASPSMQVFFRDVDNFIRMVKRGYNPIYSAKNWAFGRSRSDGEKIHHEVLIAGPKGKEWVALYSLQKQDNGDWKIISVQLLKSQAKST